MPTGLSSAALRRCAQRTPFPTQTRVVGFLAVFPDFIACGRLLRRGAMGSFPPVQSVTRAIDLLQAPNREPVSTIISLHVQTGIPNPSIVRLLQTFAVKGLVRRAPKHGAYHLTSQVRSL